MLSIRVSCQVEPWICFFSKPQILCDFFFYKEDYFNNIFYRFFFLQKALQHIARNIKNG